MRCRTVAAGAGLTLMTLALAPALVLVSDPYRFVSYRVVSCRVKGSGLGTSDQSPEGQILNCSVGVGMSANVSVGVSGCEAKAERQSNRATERL